MKRQIMGLIFIGVCVCMIIATVASVACAADDVIVTAGFNKRTALVGEELHLTISIKGNFGTVPRPRLPRFEGFNWFYLQQSSRIESSAKTKEQTKVLEFIFVFMPQQVGTFDIGPFDVRVEGVTYRHPVIPITILASRGQSGQSVFPANAVSQQAHSLAQKQTATSSSLQSQQQQKNGSSSIAKGADSNIFLKTFCDKKVMYVGEQTTIRYSLFTRLDTRYEGFKEEPQTKGFWAEDISMQDAPNQENVRVGAYRFVKADVRKIALFPTQPGEYVIDPGVVQCMVKKPEPTYQANYFGGFFDDRFFSSTLIAEQEQRVLGAESIQIVVKPLPMEGRPENFKSMIGSYGIEATIDRQQVAVNESITIIVTVQGKGNVETIVAPQYEENEKFRVVPGKVEKKKFKATENVVGWKRFNYVFIPKEQGDYTLGPFSIDFFDPAKENYDHVTTAVFNVKVIAPKKDDLQDYLQSTVDDTLKRDVERVDTGIYFIKEQLASRKYTQVVTTVVRWGWRCDALLVLCIGIAILFKKRQIRFDADNALRRNYVAYGTYVRQMKTLHKKAHTKNTDVLADVSADIARITMDYFSDKFDLARHALTAQQLEMTFEEKHVDETLRKTVIELFEQCDYARFASSSLSQKTCKELIFRSQQLVAQFEKLKVGNA